MKRLGFFSGKIYDCDAKDIKECAVLISDSYAADPEVVKITHSRYKNKCACCGGCTMSREAAGIKYSPYAEISGMNIELVLKEIIPGVHAIGCFEAKGNGVFSSNEDVVNFIVEQYVKWVKENRPEDFRLYINTELLKRFA